MVDKNLFLHDLAVVAIMKNEAPYLKEWLDYHLLAGVDHFYLYDNDSPDNQAEVAAPYVKRGIVDYFSAPGKAMQYAICNDAVKRFKFHCRYMAFIDLDEFIFPKSVKSISEVVDELLSKVPNAAGLGIHWQCFGSNGQATADYSRGVLERFTRRAPVGWYVPPNTDGNPYPHGNCYIKNIVNPRRINLVKDPHTMNYFDKFYTVDENSTRINHSTPFPITANKIAVNHYYVKSKDEFIEKINRGSATRAHHQKKLKWFDLCDRNEEFDDGILKYRDERAKVYQPPDNSHVNERLLTALMKNLSPVFLPNTTKDFYSGKMETFLTCRAVSSYLKTKLSDDAPAKFFEETALKAVLRSLSSKINFADVQIFIKELPNFLSLEYPVVKDLRGAALQLIPQLMNVMRINSMWEDYIELDYIRDILRSDSFDGRKNF